MPKQPLSPESVLVFLIRMLALLAVACLCLGLWHPWQAAGGSDWRWIGVAIACVALAVICSWGLHALKR